MTSNSAEHGFRECLRFALRLLARRDHFSSELERKLREKGFSSEAIAYTTGRLREMRYLDDRRALAAYAEEVKRHRKGFLFFVKKLIERGAYNLFAESEVRSVYSLEEERRIARELSTKMRWGTTDAPRRLLSRGFSTESFR